MNRWTLIALTAAAGTVSLAVLFPRFDPHVDSTARIDRHEAMRRAMAISARYGVETVGWRAIATAESSDKFLLYRRTHPKDPVTRLFIPYMWEVGLMKPGSNVSVRAVLFGDGKLKEWEWKTTGPKGQGPDSVTPQTVLYDFAGEDGGLFHAAGSDWEWNAGGVLTAQLTEGWHDGRLTLVKLSPQYDKAFDASYSSTSQISITALSTFSVFSVFLAALIAYLRSGKKNMVARVVIGLTVAVLPAVLWQVVAGASYQKVEYLLAGNTLEKPARFGAYLGQTYPILGMLVLAGAAYAMRCVANRSKWTSLELLARGRVYTRLVGGAATGGLLGAIGIAAIPYLVSLLAPRTMLFWASGKMSSASPLIETFSPGPAIVAIGCFGFLLPLFGRIRNAMLARVLFGIGGLLTAGITDPTLFSAFLPDLIAAAATLGLLLLIYLKFDLLAVMMAAFGAPTVRLACVLLAQPAPTLHGSGVRMMAMAGAGLGLAALVAWKGREVELSEDAEELLPAAANKSDRERLEAEFEVARRAQQAALPPAPPAIAGFTFSASCDPAQQVGGDLYDFFPLPEGRLGVAVADVSGKGVPAALYMMVTKGLMSSASRDGNELKFIFEEVNYHLYRTCKRKSFVTMAAVALDPGSSRVRYTRAGHNPIVWRRKNRGETVQLKSRGLGLGMTSREMFARTLEIVDLDVEPGDTLVLYSDGVTEAFNEAMELFGDERLMRSVEKIDGLPAAEGRTAILRDLAEFVGTMPPSDDITVVVVKAGAVRNQSEPELV